MSAWAASRPTPLITGHFRDESFWATDCTGTDNQTEMSVLILVHNCTMQFRLQSADHGDLVVPRVRSTRFG